MFGDRLALIEIEGEHHSTLASSFHEGASVDAVAYLKVVLGGLWKVTK